MVYNVMLAGVGGQGLMLLSGVMGTACAETNLPVITGEQHGLSQRSGSINVHLRMGEGRLSPLIPPGSADVLIAMEALETLRYVEYLRDDGRIVMNTRVMHPLVETATLVARRENRLAYFTFEQVVERLRTVTGNILTIDALSHATQAGIPRAENVVLLGATSVLPDFPLPRDVLTTAIRKAVPKKTIDANLRAFEAGRTEGLRILKTLE
jgi:indolepyruvate ferredoxin oxidoreductase beta subunit